MHIFYGQIYKIMLNNLGLAKLPTSSTMCKNAQFETPNLTTLISNVKKNKDDKNKNKARMKVPCFTLFLILLHHLDTIILERLWKGRTF